MAGLGAAGLALGPAKTGAAEPNVLVRTTGNNSELRETMPITRRAGARERVVASMGPGKLPTLGQQDRFDITAEVQVTTDCLNSSRRCARRPYNYNPIVASRLVLANGPGKVSGPGRVDLSSRARINATRFQPGSQPRLPPRVAAEPQAKRLPLNNARKVVYSQRLDDLQRGEQLVVGASPKGSDTAKVADGGQLRVTRYPSALRE